jgi:cellulose synthase/poly-beta-1,6-N-acetylglucosamine synthase-like glycosyltransferase
VDVSFIVGTVVWFFLLYFAALNTAYLLLNLLAYPALRRRLTLLPLEDLPPVHPDLVLPVTIIISARDCASSIVERIQSARQLYYPEYEIVVVNDGSRDATLEVLRESFGLEAFPEVYWRRIPALPVRTIYHSRVYPNLRVVDKERGGTADALNVGINASRFPLFFVFDPRWTLRRDGLRVLVEPFLDDSDTVAAASTTRVTPESELSDQAFAEPELPATLFERLQLVEHLREPVFCRLGWARLNATLGIADAAILFRKDAVVDAGGFRAEMIAEEMEVIARLHLVQRTRGDRYRIHVVPEPICRVPAAATLGKLREQRMRWQVALAQSLARNRALVREHGFAARLAYPFFLLFECYGPAIEIAAYVLMVVMFALGLIPGMALAAFLALVFSMGFMVSMSTLLLEDMSFRLYPRWGQAARLAIAAIVENLGYRQLVAFWRFDALMRWWQQPR